MSLECFGSPLRCLNPRCVRRKLKRMNARKQWMVRLILSLAFGIMVAWAPLYLTLGGDQARSDFSFERRVTLASLKKMDKILGDKYRSSGTYPARLENVGLQRRDGWKRPFLYSLSDGKPLIESLGSDGKRGGVGLNADLSNRNLYPAAARISFWQRPFEREAQGVALASLICGSIASALFLAAVRRQTFEPKTLPALGMAILFSLALASFGALVIAMFHVPSGH